MVVVMLLQLANTGASLSLTVTVKLQLTSSATPGALLPVQVTVVVPLLKVEPEAGTQVTVATGQPAVAVGGV